MLTDMVTSASSAGVPGFPTMVAIRNDPIEFAPAPLASGVPTVSCVER